MDDIKTIKRIGFILAFKAITAGLLIGYIIMALLVGPLWLLQFDYAPTIIFATLVAYLSGYYFGGMAGVFILKHNRPPILFGIIGGFLVVWCSTFTASLIGLVKEGLPNQNEISAPFHDYVYKPMASVTIFGFLPILLIGIWYGLSIKKRGRIISVKHN